MEAAVQPTLVLGEEGPLATWLCAAIVATEGKRKVRFEASSDLHDELICAATNGFAEVGLWRCLCAFVLHGNVAELVCVLVGCEV